MNKFLKYDFLELFVYDVHGTPRGRLIARHRLESVLKYGIGLYAGVCYFGIQDEPTVHEYFSARCNYGNLMMFPMAETLTDVLPCARGDYNVGQVMCALKSLKGETEVTTPRFVAEKQLLALSAMGYSIRSSMELEFAIYHADTGKPLGHDRKWGSMRVIGQNMDTLLDFVTELKAVGVHVDAVHPEAGCGQYEMTLDVEEGLKGPDMATQFKNAAHIFFKTRDLVPVFVTKDKPQGFSHGFHINFSLWTPEGKPAFLDANDPDKFSSVGRHWLAGLIAHAKALTALCCPTVNCYRRLHNPWVPGMSDWSKESRTTCFRLKVEGQDNVYLENRVPSSACNPYLVMAGVVAAGMDGLKRKLSLEEAKCDQELPRSLESALKALEEDEYMVEALGKEFVMMYTYTKRTFEIEPLKAFADLSDEERFSKELEIYHGQL